METTMRYKKLIFALLLPVMISTHTSPINLWDETWKKIGLGIGTYIGISFINSQLSKQFTQKTIHPTPSQINQKPSHPVIYDPRYNISLINQGVDKFINPFDGYKYEKIANYLLEENIVNGFHQPLPVSLTTLEKVHSREYLNDLKSSWNVAGKIMGSFELAWIPNWIFQWKILTPMKAALGGTLKAVDLVTKHNHDYAINLGAGYHHAQSDSFPELGGYCAFGDIQLAVKKFHKSNPNGKVLIVDLDAHQGNGYEYDLHSDPKVHFFDVYNKNEYPGYDKPNLKESYFLERIWHRWIRSKQEEPNRKYIHYNHPLHQSCNDKEYLEIVKNDLETALKKFQPDLIIYNAGTDILAGDPEGKFNLKEETIITRDTLVFKHAFDHNTKIILLTSGGYTPQSAKVVSHSIHNILNLAKDHNKS